MNFNVLKKIGALSVIVCIIVSLFSAFECVCAEGDNILPDADSFFEGETHWDVFYNGSVHIEKGEGDPYLVYQRTQSQSWYSPILNIYDHLKKDVEKNGESVYKIDFDIKVANFSDSAPISFNVLFRCGKETVSEGKLSDDGKEYRFSLGTAINIETNVWKHFSNTFSVAASDVSDGSGKYNFCFDGLDDRIEEICLDNVIIKRTDGEISSKTGTLQIIDSDRASAVSISKPLIILPKRTMRPVRIENLAEGISSDFNGALNVSQTGWHGFSTEKVKIGKSYDGNCIMLENPEHSWSSPALNLRNYIDVAGTYSVGMMVKLTANEEIHNFSLMIRGGAVNSFMQAYGGNVYAILQRLKARSGAWQYVTATFTVEETDLYSNDAWELCFDGLIDVTKIEIDDFAICYGEEDALPPKPELTEELTEADYIEKDISKSRETFFSPEMKGVAVKTSLITAAIVCIYIVATVLIKKNILRIPKIVKKEKRK